MKSECWETEFSRNWMFCKEIFILYICCFILKCEMLPQLNIVEKQVTREVDVCI